MWSHPSMMIAAGIHRSSYMSLTIRVKFETTYPILALYPISPCHYHHRSWLLLPKSLLFTRQQVAAELGIVHLLFKGLWADLLIILLRTRDGREEIHQAFAHRLLLVQLPRRWKKHRRTLDFGGFWSVGGKSYPIHVWEMISDQSLKFTGFKQPPYGIREACYD